MQNKIIEIKIPQEKSKNYPIIIGSNLLENAFSLIKQNTKAKKFLIVTDENVDRLYYDKFIKNFDNEAIVQKIVLPAGESSKSFENYKLILDKALEFKLERKDAIIALGGGVVGDISGFAAATYLRGIDFIQVPTTLLAQVDSSVGGKVAINHFAGKNLIGAFYQPKLVLADINSLKTLPIRELKTGLAEVLKYAFIEKTASLTKTSDFMEFLSNNKKNVYDLDIEIISQIIEYSCKLKADVVSQDEKEQGLRAILNFGHTIAHSIEKCTNYTLFTHGEAVAIGIKGAFYIAKEMKLITGDYFDKVIILIGQYDLNYNIPKNIEVKDLHQSMFADKKVQSGKIRFILPVNIAEVDIFNNIQEKIILNSLKNLY
ncbi:MAG: 3-dehydroquinate synthase [Candidatus Gastranaerophilales bacterium]|nr:3-dehydroquinate synthase [Candidatus Gastranaerophilales bacterium]